MLAALASADEPLRLLVTNWLDTVATGSVHDPTGPVGRLLFKSSG